MEARYDECKTDGLLINGRSVHSFCKVMFEESYLEVLVFPPKFARSVPHLTDQEIYLEDSRGRRWSATVCNHNGSLAIRQGWPKFSFEHALKVGDFLVFHYVPDDQHFIVQIFGRSCCEKSNLCSDIGKGKQTTGAHLDVEINSETPLPKFMAGTNMVSQLTENPQVGPKDDQCKETSQFDYGDALHLNAVSFSCLVDVDGQDRLELPDYWRKDLLEREQLGEWIIYLRGLDKRVWTTIYHSKSGCDALTRGWKEVTEAYGLNAGDGCLLQLVDQQTRLFDVRKV